MKVVKTSTMLGTIALFGMLALPVGARTTADVGPLNGKWEIVMKSVEHGVDGSKPTKYNFTFVGTMTDCASSSSAALCLEFQDSVGTAISLNGSRYGEAFFLKSADGNFVMSGRGFPLNKNGMALKLKATAHRYSEEKIEDALVLGKRIPE